LSSGSPLGPGRTAFGTAAIGNNNAWTFESSGNAVVSISATGNISTIGNVVIGGTLTNNAGANIASISGNSVLICNGGAGFVDIGNSTMNNTALNVYGNTNIGRIGGTIQLNVNGHVSTLANISASGNISASANIRAGGELASSGGVSTSGNIATSAGITATLDIRGANIIASGFLSTVGNVQTNGAVIAKGDVTAFSDVRMKENIVTIDSPLEKLMEMRGVYYTRKDIPGPRRVGVIAQEIEKVLPEVVLTDSSEEKMKSVAYGNIVAILIEGMKAQQSTIDSLLFYNKL
jgi:hypothetical protein